MKTFPALVLCLLLVQAIPTVDAHVEAPSQGKSFTAGPYLVYLQPTPSTVYANTTLGLTAQLADNATGAPARGVSAALVIGGPNEYNRRVTMNEDRRGSGYLIATVLLPYEGVYSIRLLLTDDQGTYSADTDLEAYPDLPVRIRSADETEDAFVGQISTFTFEIVNKSSLKRVDGYEDVRVRLERWTDDHGQMLGSVDVTPTRVETGLWRVEHRFMEKGMYHMRFASQGGGFTYDDVPLLHLYAEMPPEEDGGEEPGDNTVPAPGLLPLVAAPALLAARRRRA